MTRWLDRSADQREATQFWPAPVEARGSGHLLDARLVCEMAVGKLEQRGGRRSEPPTAQHDCVERPAEIVFADPDGSQPWIPGDRVRRQDRHADAGDYERGDGVDPSYLRGDGALLAVRGEDVIGDGSHRRSGRQIDEGLPSEFGDAGVRPVGQPVVLGESEHLRDSDQFARRVLARQRTGGADERDIGFIAGQCSEHAGRTAGVA
jgi:hypothetical protein